jgi:hypothetical protein
MRETNSVGVREQSSYSTNEYNNDSLPSLAS